MRTLQYWYAREISVSKHTTPFLGSKNTLPVLSGNLTGTAIFQCNASGNTHTAQRHFFKGSKSVSKESPYISYVSQWATVLSAHVPKKSWFHYHAPEVSWTKEWEKRMRRPSRLSPIPLHNGGSVLIILWLASVHIWFSSDGDIIFSNGKVFPLFNYCYD